MVYKVMYILTENRNGDNVNPRKIKKFRLELGLTQEQFARQLGVTFVTVNRWEAGKTEPSNLALRQLERLGKDEVTR